MENLTKENLFNDLYLKYPDAMNVFCEWIDGYKEAVDWIGLFGNEIKFHHIPGEMQCGIWIEFMLSQGACTYEVDFTEFDLSDEITEWVKMKQQDIEILKD